MPVNVYADMRHLEQEEFGEIAYRVMDHVFKIHNEMGRFLDEEVYRNAVAISIGGDVEREVRIEVTFDDFRKNYFVDLLVGGGAAFELKAVNRIGGPHRAQLLNYLLLCGLSHGKVINVRREKVEHEFVNTQLNLSDRTAFEVADCSWRDPGPAGRSLKHWLLAFLGDVGTGLDVHLYESAVSHFFGGTDAVHQELDVMFHGTIVGRQKVRLAVPNWAFKVTTIDSTDLPTFEDHARRFLRHTSLEGIHWINITRSLVTFRSIAEAEG